MQFLAKFGLVCIAALALWGCKTSSFVPCVPIGVLGDAAELKVIGETNDKGTKITFLPDTQIFSETEFHFETLSSRLRELAFLNKGVDITLFDERTNKKQEFKYDGGIVSFVEFLNKNKNPFHKVIYFESEKNKVIVEVAIQYNLGYQENIFTFANNINTIEGGSHLVGFKTALTRTMNSYAVN